MLEPKHDVNREKAIFTYEHCLFAVVQVFLTVSLHLRSNFASRVRREIQSQRYRYLVLSSKQQAYETCWPESLHHVLLASAPGNSRNRCQIRSWALERPRFNSENHRRNISKCYPSFFGDPEKQRQQFPCNVCVLFVSLPASRR